METTKTLIERIKQHHEETLLREELERDRKNKEITNLENKIKSYMEEFGELVELANCMYDKRYANKFMFTDGICHEMGFYIDNTGLQRNGIESKLYHMDILKPRLLFGVEGGGCCGGDLVIDFTNKSITYNCRGHYHYGDCHHIKYLKDIAYNFPKWKEKIFNKIENMIR